MNFDKTDDQVSVTSNQITNNKIQPKILDWEELGRVNVIRQWANEIIEASFNEASKEDWHVIGTAVTVIHDDVEYCQEILARVAKDISFEFVQVSAHEVEGFLASTVNEFSKSNRPVLIYLEPGEWMKDQEDPSSPIINTQKTLQQRIKDFDPLVPIIFATSTSVYTDMSEGLRRAGFFDRRFLVLKPTLEEVGANFVKMIGENICSESFKENLGKIGKLLDIEFDDKRRQELIALTLKRIAKRNARKIEFSDLVHLSTKGSAESDDYPKRSDEFERKIAVHEAGHALVAMIDSAGQNIPEYVSILEAEGFFGIVTDSMSYHLAKHKFKSYADIRHQIRVCLAGRVAEHMMYGSENISAVSATDDLRRATELCFYMFSAKGMSPDMGTFEGACSNLTVELEEDKPFDKKRTELQAREYLAEQYKIVYDMLNENKQVYEEVLGQLMINTILDQGDLCKIAENNLVPCLI